MSVDLHVHSVASDGLHAPEELLQMAAATHLRAIAITDHDSVDSVGPALAEAQSCEVEVVPALELSSHIGEHDAHFLGYYLDYQSTELAARLQDLRNARDERAAHMLDLLRTKGIDIDFQDLRRAAGRGAVGRAHVAALLVEKGHVGSVAQAFDRFLTRGAPCYVEKAVLRTDEIINLVRGLGGVVVLAHPGVSGVDTHIRRLAGEGLQGIEAFHADHTLEQIQEYRRLADRLDLIVTGGSDFHGKGVRGLGVGVIDVPDWVLYGLKRLHESGSAGEVRR